jgi:uncharacterized RDD family membrane protein YckC
MTPYSTLWRRYFAALIDAFVVATPMAIAGRFLGAYGGDAGLTIGWTCAVSVVSIAYSVVMHARWGQTIGKRALSVILLNAGENRIPTWREAALRDIGQIGPTAILGGFVVAALLNGDYRLEPDRYVGLMGSLKVMNGAWTLIELVTMLTNDKRRALHDFIAGTVVMRTDSVPVGVLESVQ